MSGCYPPLNLLSATRLPELPGHVFCY